LVETRAWNTASIHLLRTCPNKIFQIETGPFASLPA
tara:strand:+ start:135994 stop:136101 length:108 start_codon:yes stop_codon:yes gene_type:complete